MGAIEVNALFTHPVLSGDAINRIKESKISNVITTDTIKVPENKKFNKLEIVSVSGIFAEAINRTHNNESISKLFF
jgi:ribose-phosphate pyrophosphokinase